MQKGSFRSRTASLYWSNDLSRKSIKHAIDLAELAVATPQVIAHRMQRMMAAGHAPTARDRREMRQMGSEKMQAFAESWTAMSLQSMAAQQQMALSMWRAWLSPVTSSSAQRLSRQWQRAALDVASKGLEPVHRRAVANAKRLGKAKGR